MTGYTFISTAAFLASLALSANAQCSVPAADNYECAESTTLVNLVGFNVPDSGFEGIEIALQHSTGRQSVTVKIDDGANVYSQTQDSAMNPPSFVEFIIFSAADFDTDLTGIMPTSAAVVVEDSNQDVIGCLQYGTAYAGSLVCDVALPLWDGAPGLVFRARSNLPSNFTIAGNGGNMDMSYSEETAGDFGYAWDNTLPGGAVGGINPDQGFASRKKAQAFVNEILDVGAGDCVGGDTNTAYRGVEIAYYKAAFAGDIEVTVTPLGGTAYTETITPSDTAEEWEFKFIQVADAIENAWAEVSYGGEIINAVAWGTGISGQTQYLIVSALDLPAHRFSVVTNSRNSQPTMEFAGQGAWISTVDRCSPGAANEGQTIGNDNGGDLDSSSSSSSSTTTKGGTVPPGATTTTKAPGVSVPPDFTLGEGTLPDVSVPEDFTLPDDFTSGFLSTTVSPTLGPGGGAHKVSATAAGVFAMAAMMWNV